MWRNVMRSFILLTMSLLMALVVSVTVHADVPQMINYQGYLTDTDGNPLDTTIGMAIRIYDSAIDGNMLWAESHPAVTVTNGLFTIMLGSVNPVADSIFAGSDRWLGITVGIAPIGESEIRPRTKLASVPYASRVGTLDSASGGAISGDLEVSGKLVLGAEDKQPITASEILSKSGILAIGKEVGGSFDPAIQVAIGTTNPYPSSKLTLEQGWSDWITLRSTQTGDQWHIHNPQSGDKLVIGVEDQSGNQIWALPAITNTGKVGIGEGDPEALLTVNSNISGVNFVAPGITIGNPSGNSLLALGQDTDDLVKFAWVAQSGAIPAHADISAGSKGLTLQGQGGYVGIGTPSPERPLHIYSAGHNCQVAGIRLEYYNTSTPNGCPGSSMWDIIGHGNLSFSNPNTGGGMALSKDGFLRIGPGSPVERLQLGDEFVFHDGGVKILGRNYRYLPALARRIVDGEVSTIRFNEVGDICLKTAPYGTAGSPIVYSNQGLMLKNNGNVGIDCSSPLYRLDVNGTIRAKELRIELTGCDFVFEEHYPLLSLKERKAIVLRQKHLPHVGSAQEMQQGAALGETMMSILRNVEEHEKYLYQYDERIAKLEQLVLKQSKTIEKLNSFIEQQIAATEGVEQP